MCSTKALLAGVGAIIAEIYKERVLKRGYGSGAWGWKTAYKETSPSDAGSAAARLRLLFEETQEGIASMKAFTRLAASLAAAFVAIFVLLQPVSRSRPHGPRSIGQGTAAARRPARRRHG